MLAGPFIDAALVDVARSARLAITEGQRAYSLGRLPPRLTTSGLYARRARERLHDAWRAGALEGVAARFSVRRSPGLRQWYVHDALQGRSIAGGYTWLEAVQLMAALEEAPEALHVTLIRRAWWRQPLALADLLKEVTPPANT